MLDLNRGGNRYAIAQEKGDQFRNPLLLSPTSAKIAKVEQEQLRGQIPTGTRLLFYATEPWQQLQESLQAQRTNETQK